MRDYPIQHPVFPATLAECEVASLIAETAHAMSFRREQIADFIVPRTTFYNLICPNCEGGNVSDSDRWKWSADEPDRIACRFCGMVFPNESYPLDHETTVTDSTGTKQTYRYWRGSDGYRYYMQMRVENCWKIYMEQSVCRLARLYAGTGQAPYARQALLILDRLADVYPHYNPHGIESWATMAPQIHDIQLLPAPPDGLQPVPGLTQDLPGYKTPYPYCSGMRADSGDNWFYAEMPPHLAYAYDLVAGSDEPRKLSDELGKDVARNIEAFFRATANYARTFPIYLGNMDPSLIDGLAVIGRVIGEPEFVHDAMRRANLILGRQFYPDGIWREGAPSYHSQTVNGLRRCLEGPLKGYSDPEGYVNPGDGLHFSDLNSSRDAPMLIESFAALDRMCLPNGHVLTIHDTWAQESLGRPIRPVPDKRFETTLMWALGQAIMGLGRGENGVQANLHFSGSYGHAHFDNLDLMLFAHGREMISDIGYTHTILRPFSVGSLAHNLVVVDRADQQGADGRLLGWGVCGDHLRFCEAAAESAYPGNVSVYRRAVATVALPEPGAYVIDVFRVEGGSTHDWCLHGSADHDQALTCSRELEPRNGSLLPAGVAFERADLGSGQGWQSVRNGVNLLYGLFQEQGCGTGEADWSVSFTCAGLDAPVLQTTVLGQPGTTVHCGVLPSIRRARESNTDVWKHTMPAVIARRSGADLHSLFIAVHHSYRGQSQLLEIGRVPLADAPASAVGIQCRGDNFCDYHFCGPDAGSRMQGRNVAVSATARYAFVRVCGDDVTKMVIVDGTQVTFGGTEVVAPEAPSGLVLGVERVEAGQQRNALIVDAKIAPRAGLPEERVIVEFGNGSTFGLAVREILREGGRTVIVLAHRPGFELSDDGESATHTHHPHWTMSGRPRFRLPNLIVWERSAS